MTEEQLVKQGVIGIQDTGKYLPTDRGDEMTGKENVSLSQSNQKARKIQESGLLISESRD